MRDGSYDREPGVSLRPEIIEHYTNDISEMDRLNEGLGLVERIRIREIMDRHLPKPPAVVCDIGGGAGVHSFWLAERCYEVHLLDAVPRHIEQARSWAERPGVTRLASMRVGDARCLEYPDECADALLFLGPLYHLTERNERLCALAEARRVMRPGAVLFAGALSRYAETMVGLQRGYVWDADFRAMMLEELRTGQHRKPANWRVLTTAFFHHPDELRDELLDAGFAYEETLGIQGPGWLVPDFEANLADAERRQIILHLARVLEREPVLSPHMVAVARKAQ